MITYDVTGVLLHRNADPACTYVIAAKAKHQVTIVEYKNMLKTRNFGRVFLVIYLITSHQIDVKNAISTFKWLTRIKGSISSFCINEHFLFINFMIRHALPSSCHFTITNFTIQKQEITTIAVYFYRSSTITQIKEERKKD